MDSSSRRSTTAEGAAFCRALGATERDPQRRNPDHLAHNFVTRPAWRMGLLPLLRRMARRDVERRLPGALLLHHARTRVFDELTLGALRAGTGQVVMVGAGGDSRAYRFAHEWAGGRIFEVDHPETGAWKQRCVHRMLGRAPAHVRYVPVDLGTQALLPALERAGFDRAARTLFLWEGVTMYLSAAAVDAVLSVVARSAPGSAIAFDHLHADALTHPERYEGAAAQSRFAASRGEPFLFGMAPDGPSISAFLRARSLECARRWSHEELRDLYPGPGFAMPYLGIVHARVASRS
jgi:methyltransferase (TIGR00027 family)